MSPAILFPLVVVFFALSFAYSAVSDALLTHGSYLRPYLGYVWRHKVAVYRAGRSLGVGRWQLLRHDLSKLRPDELMPYARYFYGAYQQLRADFKQMQQSGPLAASATSGWVLTYLREQMFPFESAFNVAWLRHQHRSPHHWQHWVLRMDDGTTHLLEMPERYWREMVADWMGAGMASKGHGLDRAIDETRAWYEKAKAESRILLHSTTMFKVEAVLGVGR